MKPNKLFFIACIFIFMALAGCTFRAVRGGNMRASDLYKKIVNESSKPIVYSTLWYYCTYDQWPKDKDDLVNFLSEEDSAIDLSQYTTIKIQQKEDGNLICTYTIKGNRRELSVDVSFNDFKDDNFDCSMFPVHKSGGGVYRI